MQGIERWTWPFITQQVAVGLGWVWLLWVTRKMVQEAAKEHEKAKETGVQDGN